MEGSGTLDMGTENGTAGVRVLATTGAGEEEVWAWMCSNMFLCRPAGAKEGDDGGGGLRFIVKVTGAAAPAPTAILAAASDHWISRDAEPGIRENLRRNGLGLRYQIMEETGRCWLSSGLSPIMIKRWRSMARPRLRRAAMVPGRVARSWATCSTVWPSRWWRMRALR